MDSLVSTSELPRHITPAAVVLPAVSALSIARRPVDMSFWTDIAPAKVVKDYHAEDEGKAWRAWQRHLARRAEGTAAAFADPNKIRKRLLWGIQPGDLDAEGLAAIDGIARAVGAGHDQLRSPQEILVDQSWENPNAAFLYLVCAYQFPALAQRLSHTAWWDLLGLLQQ